MAAKYFSKAITLCTSAEWASLRLDCLKSLGFAYLKAGQTKPAKRALLEALAWDGDCASSHCLISQCYQDLGEEFMAAWHARKAKQLGRH